MTLANYRIIARIGSSVVVADHLRQAPNAQLFKVDRKVEHFVDRDEMTSIHHVFTVEVSGTPYESKLAAPFLYERVSNRPISYVYLCPPATLMRV